jgi:hypothetical protein
VSGADSYRKIHAFIEAHYATLDGIFGLNWKRTPVHTTIRNIIRGVSSNEIEKSFRAYSAELTVNTAGKRLVSFDGKVLRGSFDHFKDQQAVQILSVIIPKNWTTC